MESATLFTLARVFGLKAGAIFAVTANGATNGFEVKAGIEDSIDVAIEGVGRLRRFGV
jgi:uridine phosphorylase